VYGRPSRDTKPRNRDRRLRNRGPVGKIKKGVYRFRGLRKSEDEDRTPYAGLPSSGKLHKSEWGRLRNGLIHGKRKNKADNLRKRDQNKRRPQRLRRKEQMRRVFTRSWFLPRSTRKRGRWNYGTREACWPGEGYKRGIQGESSKCINYGVSTRGSKEKKCFIPSPGSLSSRQIIRKGGGTRT